MTQKTSTKTITQFIWIRVLACLAIVLLHTLFTGTVYFDDTITEKQLAVSKTIENLLMWAVPSFLMVTGSLLLDPNKTISADKLFGKYLRRIALALVSFTLIFQIMDFIAGDQDTVVKGWLSNLLQGHSWAHMWYLYLMIGIYLTLPFYKMITRQASLRQIWILILIIVVFVSILPMVRLAGLDCGFYIPTQLIYPVYLFAGYALYKKNLPAWASALMAIVSSIAIIMLSIATPQADIFGYDSILVIIQSLSLYSLLLRLKLPAGEILHSIDQCGFGIYLIHMIGVRAVMKWVGFNPYAHSPVFCIAAMVLLFFSISYLITLALQSIPTLDLL